MKKITVLDENVLKCIVGKKKFSIMPTLYNNFQKKSAALMNRKFRFSKAVDFFMKIGLKNKN